VTLTIAPTIERPTRRLVAALGPFVLASALHLVTLQTGPDWAVTATKAVLMPLLALAVLVVARPRRDAAVALLLAAIGLSWAGDVALSLPGGFVAGLVCFLLAHLGYITLFLRMPRARRRPPAWTLVYLAWFPLFLALLGPHTGALLVPVALYGVVLGAMGTCAALHGLLVAAGGALFVMSDSVLALGRFLPGYDFPLHDLVVMSSYLAAQALITVGVLRSLSSERR
jgi:uncharacterized membrane protein YhhN